MPSLISRVTSFARSPQGRTLAQRAQRYVRSPEGRRTIERARSRLIKRQP